MSPQAPPAHALPGEAPRVARDDLAQAVAAWRERCGPQAEPWRVRFVEALWQRTQAQQGEVRLQLEARLRRALAEPASVTDTAATTSSVSTAPSALSPLAALRAHMAEAVAARGSPAQAAAAPELEAVRRFRATWSRLSVEQRVRQAQAKVPSGAGPLNSQRLVHEALDGLRQASPAYLHRLMVQVEALLWLEQAAPAAEAGPSAKAALPRAPRSSGGRRTPRSGPEAGASRTKR